LKWIELNYHKHGDSFCREQWKYSFQRGPSQENGHDCGVFVLSATLFILDNMPLCYNQSDMEDFRRKWVHDILQLEIKSDYKYNIKHLVVDLESDFPTIMTSQSSQMSKGMTNGEFAFIKTEDPKADLCVRMKVNHSV
jgi:hypothetical protein